MGWAFWVVGEVSSSGCWGDELVLDGERIKVDGDAKERGCIAVKVGEGLEGDADRRSRFYNS